MAAVGVRDRALACLARRTGGALAIPVEVERLDGVGPFGARLPLIVGWRRADERDAMVAGAGHEPVGLDGPGVHEMALRSEVLVPERRMHVAQHGPVHHRGGRGLDVSDQVGLPALASLREVDCVADPRRLAFLGVVDVKIMGRCHHHS